MLSNQGRQRPTRPDLDQDVVHVFEQRFDRRSEANRRAELADPVTGRRRLIVRYPGTAHVGQVRDLWRL